jgi:hypothetical protein
MLHFVISILAKVADACLALNDLLFYIDNDPEPNKIYQGYRDQEAGVRLCGKGGKFIIKRVPVPHKRYILKRPFLVLDQENY